MGSWLYAFLTPGPRPSLRVADALCALRTEDLDLDSQATEVLPDEDGHCEPRGREFELGTNAWTAATTLLNTGVDIQVMLRNSELYLVCVFARCAKQPHVVLGWPFSLFKSLTEDRRERYLRIVAGVAEAADASSVVLVLEPPGYFEDRIVCIDAELLVDAQLSDGRAIQVQEVWVSGGVATVEGATLTQIEAIARYDRSVALPWPSKPEIG